MKNKLTIICCIFNEFNILKKKLSLLSKKFNNEKFYHEIIFVDNNSNDGSKNFLKTFEKNNKNKKIKFIFNKNNIGKGGSIKKAIKRSSGDIAVIFDIDEYELKDIKIGFNLFIKKKCSFLIGSRISKKNYFIYKKNYYGVILLTKILNYLYQTNLTDSASATKFCACVADDGACGEEDTSVQQCAPDYGTSAADDGACAAEYGAYAADCDAHETDYGACAWCLCNRLLCLCNRQVSKKRF